MKTDYDLIIIGAGPAGMTAAIYSARSNMKTAIIENISPGGKMTKTFKIDNYTGINSINGVDLAMQMYDHMIENNVTFLMEETVEIINTNDYKIVKTNKGSYTANTIIIASGTKERLLNIENEKELTSKGVSYCAVCDGPFFRDKTVTIIGGGNSALEESIHIANLAKKVNIIIRRDTFSNAQENIIDTVINNPKITIINNSIPIRIIGEKFVEGIEIKNKLTNETKILQTDGIFPYIGSIPNTGFAKELGILNENGFISVNSRMETSVPGIYAAGDAIIKDLRQVITACNDGAIAATNAFHFIND